MGGGGARRYPRNLPPFPHQWERVTKMRGVTVVQQTGNAYCESGGGVRVVALYEG